MNVYQIKMKIAEADDTLRIYDVLADSLQEAVKKAKEINQQQEGSACIGDEWYRVVTAYEKIRGVV